MRQKEKRSEVEVYDRFEKSYPCDDKTWHLNEINEKKFKQRIAGLICYLGIYRHFAGEDVWNQLMTHFMENYGNRWDSHSAFLEFDCRFARVKQSLTTLAKGVRGEMITQVNAKKLGPGNAECNSNLRPMNDEAGGGDILESVPSESMLFAEGFHELNDELQKLPDRVQEILKLRLEGFSNLEIASKMGVTEGRINQITFSTFGKLKASLSAD